MSGWTAGKNVRGGTSLSSVVDETGKRYVARLSWHGLTTEEMEARASLIAAAPDLHALAEHVRDCRYHGPGRCPDCTSMARAALAKAEARS